MIPLSATEMANGVRAGNRRLLAKAITLIESTLPAHQQMARDVIQQLLPYTGQAIRLGITGVPGVGKSVFIENLGMNLIQQGHRLAVLAVDPSSSRSGGSILADKTRMENLSGQADAFIRPSPAGNTLGGGARKTRETLLACEAAGFDVVIVETVGVGQSETTVSSMVDFFLVLMLAGAGDELQGIKKGVLELADAVAINKADGDNRENAERARRAYENALHFLMPVTRTWQPPVLACSGQTNQGLDAIWQTVLDHRAKLSATGELGARRRRQAVAWMWALIEEGLKERFFANSAVAQRLESMLHAVENENAAPPAVAEELLFLLDKTG